MAKKEKEPKPQLAVRSVEFIQRWEDGGHPLSHEVANSIDAGHGTPLRVVVTRDLVALLNRIESACTYTAATVAPGNSTPSKEHPSWVEVHGGRAGSSYNQLNNILDKLRPLLKEWDHFVDRTGLD